MKTELFNVLTNIVYTRRKLPPAVFAAIAKASGEITIRIESPEMLFENVLPLKCNPRTKQLEAILPDYAMPVKEMYTPSAKGCVFHDTKNRKIVSTDGKLMAIIDMPETEKSESDYLTGPNSDSIDVTSYPDWKQIAYAAEKAITTHSLARVNMLTGIADAVDHAKDSLHLINRIYAEIADNVYVWNIQLLRILEGFAAAGDTEINFQINGSGFAIFEGKSGLKIISLYRSSLDNNDSVYNIQRSVENALARLPENKYWSRYKNIEIAVEKLTVLDGFSFDESKEMSPREKWNVPNRLLRAGTEMMREISSAAFFNREIHDYAKDIYCGYLKECRELSGTWTAQSVYFLKNALEFAKVKTSEESKKIFPEFCKFYEKLYAYAESLTDVKIMEMPPEKIACAAFKSGKELNWTEDQFREFFGSYYDTAAGYWEDAEFERIRKESLKEEKAAEESAIKQEEKKEQKQAPIADKTEPAESWMKKHVIFCRCSVPAPDPDPAPDKSEKSDLSEKSEKPVSPGPLTKAGSVSLRFHPFHSVSPQSQPETVPIRFTPFSSVPAPESAVSAPSDRVYIPPGVPLPEPHFSDSSGVSGGLSPGLEKHPDLHIAGMPDHPP